MGINLIEIDGNSATFENSEGSLEGSLTWNDPVENGGIWEVTFQGTDTLSDPISTQTTEIDQSETINPTKVFWWIANKLKEVLCPECE